MRPEETYRAGEGPLTIGRVLREARGMLRRGYARVALVALILFVPPPLLVQLVDGLRRGLESDPSLVGGLGFLIGLVMVTAIRLFGPVVYAGYLDEAVGREYFHDEDVPFGEVLRSLPWLRLLAADLLVVVGAIIGLSLFIVPGIVFLTLFALVGPVIVQERHGLVDGFRRTYELCRRAWRLTLLLVVALLGLEHLVAEILHEVTGESQVAVQMAVEWVLAASIGAVVGLIEVALATELMTRYPLPEAEGHPDPGDPGETASAAPLPTSGPSTP